MSILINSSFQMFTLIIGLAGFFWLAFKYFERAISLTLFLLPLYLVKIKLFFIPLNILEILILILFLIWLFNKRWREIDLIKIKTFTLPSIIILLAAILSALLSSDLQISAGILKGWFVFPMAFSLIIATEIKSQIQIRKILFSLALSAGAAGAISLVYYFLGKVSFDHRLSGFFLSPNHLAMYLAPGFLLGLGLVGFRADRVEKTLLLVGLICSGLALYLTFSYLAWLSVLLMVVFWFLINFDQWQANKNKIIVYGLLFIIILAFLFFSQWGSEKLNNLIYSSRSSWQSRIMIWQSAGEIIKDNVVFGIGPGMFQEYYLKYQSHFAVPYLEWAVPQPHNLFLAFWLQCGIFGLAGFIWLLLIFFKSITAQIKKKNQLALILVIVMGYMVLHGLADTTYFKNDLATIFWTIIALSLCLEKNK